MANTDVYGRKFPSIKYVSDRHGAATSLYPRLGTTVETGAIVHEGDRLTFRCSGGGRPGDPAVRWWLHPYSGERQRPVIGDCVELTWTVGRSTVRRRIYIGIGMAGETRYHRQGGPDEEGYDGWVVFYYAVAPSDRPRAEPDGRIRLQRSSVVDALGNA
ncbi:hypothetical protein SAMN04515671_2600 [Nakamurella panacisegetis]|uniref:Ig-like domain-containing protein n=1 Tax=Nakamurella panacisegetis TaxID=1090615 RepID=A0A1H0P331_9ACTN|nr:hypothetical protein [Nakamurella panacisegetis]SDO99422.1 hypothetical protein SAMN04515671_2600 [Nakamurella panacisegetis]